MPETRGGYRPPSAEVERKEKGYHVPPELLAVILAAVISCGGSEKRITDETVVPGTAQVEAREKKLKSDAVYELLRKEVAEIDPKKLIAFEAILEDEALPHFQNKFSSPEDKWRDKRDYIFYTRKIESLFSSLKNKARREEIYNTIARHCEENDVPYELALAVMANENGGRSGPVSSAGAQGLMQVMPKTARKMGVSESQMRTIDGQVKAGVRALAAYYKKFGQWGVALAAYNGGSGDIAKFLIKHKFLPKKHFLKSVERNFAGNPEEFYTEVPDITAMYEKSFNKQALGYPFRVIAMSKILEAIEWGDNEKPFRIKKEKLPHPELWDKRKGVETKSGDSGVKKTKRQPARINKQKILASTWKRQRR